MERHVVLYDADCGFCKWSLAKVLAWDRRRRLRPVSLQSPEAGALLAGIPEERRMSSWHLVGPDGRVRSGGEAVAPLARLLPAGRPIALVAQAAPGLTNAMYGWTARHRSPLGRRLGRGSVRRAERRIAAHS